MWLPKFWGEGEQQKYTQGEKNEHFSTSVKGYSPGPLRRARQGPWIEGWGAHVWYTRSELICYCATSLTSKTGDSFACVSSP